jgi:hypothetical protein
MWRTENGTSSCPFKDQITILRIHAQEARGPIIARHKQQGLIKSEEFCLQVDAHSDFAFGWDHMLLDDYMNTKNKYAVLTSYPHPITELQHNYKTNGQGREIPHLCKVDINAAGMPRNGRARRIRNMRAPKLTNLWAAGLSFSLCDAERNVRNDPTLNYVFDGEEFSRAARMWTNGFDFYTPTTAAVFHDYSKAGTVVEFPFDYTIRERSHERIKDLLKPYTSRAEHDAKFGVYGLGTKRTLEGFLEHTGMWPYKYPATNYRRPGDDCTKSALTWVPYQESGQDATKLSREQAAGQTGTNGVSSSNLPNSGEESLVWFVAKIVIFCVVAVVGVFLTVVCASFLFGGGSGSGEGEDWSLIQRGGGGSLLGDSMGGAGGKKPALAVVATAVTEWANRMAFVPCFQGSTSAMLSRKHGGHMD